MVDISGSWSLRTDFKVKFSDGNVSVANFLVVAGKLAAETGAPDVIV